MEFAGEEWVQRELAEVCGLCMLGGLDELKIGWDVAAFTLVLKGLSITTSNVSPSSEDNRIRE
ncbi:MAG: hypothetical protein OK422_02220 [Thaumarchaeota archaeon]|nr:hypothetical protein [Nitrososphaerota archaeon]